LTADPCSATTPMIGGLSCWSDAGGGFDPIFSDHKGHKGKHKAHKENHRVCGWHGHARVRPSDNSRELSLGIQESPGIRPEGAQANSRGWSASGTPGHMPPLFEPRRGDGGLGRCFAFAPPGLAYTEDGLRGLAPPAIRSGPFGPEDPYSRSTQRSELSDGLTLAWPCLDSPKRPDAAFSVGSTFIGQYAADSPDQAWSARRSGLPMIGNVAITKRARLPGSCLP